MSTINRVQSWKCSLDVLDATILGINELLPRKCFKNTIKGKFHEEIASELLDSITVYTCLLFRAFKSSFSFKFNFVAIFKVDCFDNCFSQ